MTSETAVSAKLKKSHGWIRFDGLRESENEEGTRRNGIGLKYKKVNGWIVNILGLRFLIAPTFNGFWEVYDTETGLAISDAMIGVLFDAEDDKNPIPEILFIGSMMTRSGFRASRIANLCKSKQSLLDALVLSIESFGIDHYVKSVDREKSKGVVVPA